jgi:hypothetical protein
MALRELFSSGRVVDLILAIMAVEFVFLSLRRGKGERTAGLLDRALAFAPGVFILLALRASLVGAAWPWIAALLAASFPIHIADLIRRRL